MDSVRTRSTGPQRVLHRHRHRNRCPAGTPAVALERESAMLDLVFVLGALAVFVIVGLIGKAVEKL